MLTELKLTNFRIFDDEVTVRFRPITVLIGRNSSGKSSIIKFLLMLQQSQGSGKPNFLSPEGDRVSLGSFPQLKNSLTRKKNLTFELSTKGPIDPGPGILEPLKSFEEIEYNNLIYKTRATVPYNSKAYLGSTDYLLVDITSGKTLTRLNTKIFSDFTFLDQVSQLEYVVDESNIRHITKASADAFLIERELLGILRYQLDSTRHLSPVRSESQRVIVAAHPSIDDVGQVGQYALPHLKQLMTEGDEDYEFILSHLNNVAGLESVRFKTSGYVSQALAKNKLTGAEVLVADYGFGVSQCLPILVQGAIMPRHTTLMVEQPEAQLHPTAQLELGSFFADLWNTRQVESIVETHSRNILLRLRRLIAKGELSREDVSVAYFTVDEDKGNMPIVKNLDINEDGSMEAGLPMEFFGADIMEGLKIGARA